ncbi:DNA-processing protein DprA [Acidocella sp.]|uniref:DNA-processing protein DprA n=1 Tax=Acidocella sp. TaxID=50710 RepID=UPI00261F65D0|nr:DNA-processing protein DprA [Acidocella sp.]
MNDPAALLRLARTEGVGPITYRRLLARFGRVEDALAALPELARNGGRAQPPRIPAEAEIGREMAALHRLGGRFLFLGAPDYPEYLAELADAPPALAVLGDAALLDQPAIGMVGARNASANGLRFAESLAADIAERHPVVSGLARGIDTASHQGALRTGRTVAVIAGGLDVPYPEENAELQRRIAANGAVVAEAPLGTAPLARHFPKRNRIIAGLTRGLVVIEAAARSGSLLTARVAGEAGREIFAVPGHPFDPRSSGGNELIRQGAHLCENAADVFENLPAHAALRRVGQSPLPGFAEPPAPWPPRAPVAEELPIARHKIMPLLGFEGVTVDEIARRCQLSVAAIRAVILELELAGVVETLPGDRVVRLEDL